MVPAIGGESSNKTKAGILSTSDSPPANQSIYEFD
jgi:hypothetical protein